MYMNDENQDVIQESSPVEEVAVSEDVQTPTESTPSKVVEKVVPYERFKEVIDENRRLKSEPKATKSLDVEDFIDISASLEGLDQRQKEYLAEQHKLTGQPIKEIRNGENFLLWNDGYQTRVEKERALKPSSTQPDYDKPKTLAERLKGASLEEQEKILADAGLWKSPRPRGDRVNIGGSLTR